MCLIIDTNVAHFLVRPDSIRTRPIVQWIMAGGTLVWGGRLTEELRHNRKVAGFLSRARASRPDEVGRKG